MKTINTIDEAKAAKPGIYPVKGAVGVVFRKTVDVAGAGAFNQRLSVHGKRRWISLGVLKRFTKLSEVGAKSRMVLSARDEGDDPIEARRDKKGRGHRAPVTFKQATAAFRKAYTPTLKGKYADRNWFAPIETHVFPALGNLLMNDIVGHDVVDVMNALDAKGLSKTALRLRVHIAAIFNSALASGARDLTRGNPADAKLIAAMRPGKFAVDDEHYSRIALTDAPLAISALREARDATDDSLMAAAVDGWLVMAACALRPGEALKMQWSEVDLEKRLVTIAAPRMKGRKGKTKPHAVPLSSLALEVLERRRTLRIGDNPNVFGVDGPPPSHTFFALAPLRAGLKPLLADKPKSPIGAPHSFRSLFTDWASDIGDFPPHLAEKALAHKLPKIQAAYRRDDGVGPRALMMESYAKWLCGVAEDNVVALPRGQSGRRGVIARLWRPGS
jgi:integrase